VSIEKKLDLLLAHFNIEYIPEKGEKRGTRWERTWFKNLPAEFVKFAMDLGWSLEKAIDVHEQFEDYWLSIPGQKGIKKDWPAVWRNWCRRVDKQKGADEWMPPS